MKLLGWLLLLCVAVAVLKAAIILISVAALAFGLFVRPRETLTFLTVLLIMSLADQHGGLVVLSLTVLVITAYVVEAFADGDKQQ